MGTRFAILAMALGTVTAALASAGAWRWRARRSAASPRLLLAPTLAALALLTAAGIAVAAVARQSARATGPGDSARAYAGMALSGQAPSFSLVDQSGRMVSLADLRGQVVVLAFMDSRCTETCPLTSAELFGAARTLGDAMTHVAFVAINVNASFARPDDVAAFTAQHHLDEIRGWRFLTGDPDTLAAVWKAYGIEVLPVAGQEDFDHTTGVFVIDQRGQLVRYLSVPLLLSAAWEGPSLHALVVAQVRGLLAP